MIVAVNFLSHYYFERFAPLPEQVLGGLLPDLLKNVDKTYSFQLHKYEHKLRFHPASIAITEGWHRHVEVDKLFHSSAFFYQHSHQLRKNIEHIVTDLPIRASFLAHIALELLLDHLLIAHNSVNVARLYEHLENIDRNVVRLYLTEFENIDIDRFFGFYDRFIESRYAEIENIPHALYAICKRLWEFDTKTKHLDDLSTALKDYQQHFLGNYREIYTFIQDKIE
jgi:acyl carrier protein phosphodiesterase